MAFAPHTNTDVHNSKNYTKQFPLILGSFVEKESGNLFEYAIRPDEGIDFAPDCMHIVYVTPKVDGVDHGFRYARVIKTVAWIAVDEDANGDPVYEKWDIKQHRFYDTSWV
jgi:hypothetical protein